MRLKQRTERLQTAADSLASRAEIAGAETSKLKEILNSRDAAFEDIKNRLRLLEETLMKDRA